MRNRFSQSEAEQRIKSQMNYTQKIKRADINIENNSSFSELEKKTEHIIDQLVFFPYKEIKPLFSDKEI